MPGKIANTLLGIVFYTIGVILVNYVFEPVSTQFLPYVELTLLTVGVFFLSGFFFGKYASILLFFSGIILGGFAKTNAVFVALAFLPLIIALFGGSTMGQMAYLDLTGKRNLFEYKLDYAAFLLIAVLVALAIGFGFDFYPPIGTLI